MLLLQTLVRLCCATMTNGRGWISRTAISVNNVLYHAIFGTALLGCQLIWAWHIAAALILTCDCCTYASVHC